MIMLASGTFWNISKIAARLAAAGISVAKLSSTSARHLLASSPNSADIAFIIVVLKASSPTFIRQAYRVLSSPIAIRNEAGSTSAATTACPSSITSSSATTTGVATGSGSS